MSFGQFDAGTDKSQFSAISFLIEQAMLKMQTVTLVKVIAVHSNGIGITGTVDVQPMVNQMQAGPNGTQTAIAHGTIYGVPFYRLQGGSSAFICDPVAGDIGMCGFAARDISSVKSTRAVANPGSQRTYDWADGLYVGGFINGVPTQYIQALAFAGGWKIHSPGDIILDSPLTEVTGDLKVDGDTTTDGNTVIDGTLNVTGASTLTGGLTAPTASITALSVSSITPIGGGSFPSPVFPVAVTFSVSGNGLTASPLKLVGDVATPGNSMVYGTNASGVRGWYAAGGGGGGTVTSVGFTVDTSFFTLTGASPITSSGTFALDLSTAFQASLATTAALAASAVQTIHVTDSVSGAGTSGSPLELTNDSATPGNSFFYGTNASGTKGWYSLPAATASILDLAHGGANVVTPSASGWTLNLNGGVGSAAFGAQGQLVLTATTLVTNTTYWKTFAGGNFDLQWYMTNQAPSPNFGGGGWGVFIRDTSTGHATTIGSSGAGVAGGANVLSLTSSAGSTIGAMTFSANIGAISAGAANLSLNVQYGWGRVTKVGNVFTVFVSLDGINWLSLGPLTSTFTATPTQIGIYQFAAGTLTFWSLSGI